MPSSFNDLGPDCEEYNLYFPCSYSSGLTSFCSAGSSCVLTLKEGNIILGQYTLKSCARRQNESIPSIWKATDCLRTGTVVIKTVYHKPNAAQQVLRMIDALHALHAMALEGSQYLQQFHDYQMWGMFHVFVFEAPSKTLQDVINAERSFPFPRIHLIQLALQMLRGLDWISADKVTDIHSQLLVHTRLSPGNVMLVHGSNSTVCSSKEVVSLPEVVLQSCQVRIMEIEAAVTIGSFPQAGRKLSPFQAPETLLGCIVFQLETGKPFLWTNGSVEELLFLMEKRMGCFPRRNNLSAIGLFTHLSVCCCTPLLYGAREGAAGSRRAQSSFTSHFCKISNATFVKSFISSTMVNDGWLRTTQLQCIPFCVAQRKCTATFSARNDTNSTRRRRAYSAEDLKRLEDQDEEFCVRINLRVRHLHSNACRRCRQYSILCVPEGQSCEPCLRDQEQCSHGDPFAHFQGVLGYGKSHNVPIPAQASPPRKQPTSQAREVRYGAPRPFEAFFSFPPPPITVDLAAYGPYTHEIITAAQAVASVQSGSPEKVMDVMALANFMVAGQGPAAPENMGFLSSLPVGNNYGDVMSNNSLSHSTFNYGNEA
ncbi:hypothetical protein BKA70DRAFT_1242533 [Coprinopsis sp. MPI-PUGE-AT-0042]|nr:hypothetical protein BKA70DRAFT_1242533 [Coprinopsis sp. MPI-PUGE-AT-0042]